ncbi:MAG: hypothetical protein ACR2J3_08625 [Aridibacter sp.]
MNKKKEPVRKLGYRDNETTTGGRYGLRPYSEEIELCKPKFGSLTYEEMREYKESLKNSTDLEYILKALKKTKNKK